MSPSQGGLCLWAGEGYWSRPVPGAVKVWKRGAVGRGWLSSSVAPEHGWLPSVQRLEGTGSPRPYTLL